MKNKYLSALLLLILPAGQAMAQAISIPDLTTVYSQPFALGTTASVAWANNNTTLLAWYADRGLTGVPTALQVPATASTTNVLANYGSPMASGTDRALGAVPLSSAGTYAFGVQFQNNTGALLEGVKLGYRAQQFRKAATAVGITVTTDLVLSYKVSSTALSSADAVSSAGSNGWVAVPSGNFTSPRTNSVNGGGTTAQFYDPNAVGNFQDFSNLLIPVNIPTGQYVLVRWSIAAAASTNGLGVDNVTVQGATIPFANFTSQPTGALDQLSTWKNGSNNSPVSFSADYQLFTLNRAASVATTWNVTGALSKLIVSSTGALTLAIGANQATTTIDVASGGSLVLQSATLPLLGAQSGTVEFAQSGAATIQAGAYKNLLTSGGAKTFATGTFNIAGDVTLNSSLDFAAAGASLLNLAGGLTLGSAFSNASVNYPALVTSGQASQTWSGATGKILQAFTLASTKTAGGLSLAGLDQVRVSSTTTLNYAVGSLFNASPDMTFFASFNADGVASAYSFSGKTQRFDATTTLINIRNSSGGGLAPVAVLGRVIASPNATRNVNFSPSSGTGTTSMERLTVAGGPTGVVNIYNNTIKLTEGNFVNSNTGDILVEGATSTLELSGTNQQLSSSVTGGETLSNLVLSGTGAVIASDINLKANLTGSFSATSNTLSLIGAVDQTLTGTILVRNLISNNTSTGIGATIGSTGTLRVTRLISSSLAGSKLTAGLGRIYLDPTAQVGILPTGASISGITAEMQLPTPALGAVGNWNLIATPLTGSAISSLFVGNPAAGLTFDPSQPGRSSLYTYDPTYLGQPTERGWRKLASAVGSTAVGTGYRTFFYTNPFFNTGGGKLSLTGSAFVGPLNRSLTYCASGCAYGVAQGGAATNGYNLVGNPYLSAIQWGSLTKTNLDLTYYIWNQAANAYGAYLQGAGSGTFGVNNVIAKGQGFFVLANAPGASLGFAEAAKLVPSTAAILREGVSDKPYLRLHAQAGADQDELMIYQDDQASAGFSGREDGRKLTNPGLNVSTVSADGQALCIDSRPLAMQASEQIVPLRTSNATLPLTLTLPENTADVRLSVLDQSTGRRTALPAGGSYIVSAASELAALALILEPASVTTTRPGQGLAARLYPNPSSGVLYVELPTSATPAQITVSDALGRVVSTSTLAASGQITLPAGSGIYNVVIQQGNARLQQRVVRK